jgi:hypothetical protein
MPRGLRHVALSISFLSPIARLPDAFFTKNIAALIFRPDARFFALTSFQSVNRPSFSLGSSSRISRSKQSFSVSLARRRPPGNIHSRSRLLLTNKTRPRLAAISLDDFAIRGPWPFQNESSALILLHPLRKVSDGSSESCPDRMRGISTRMPEVGQQRRLSVGGPLPVYPQLRTFSSHGRFSFQTFSSCYDVLEYPPHRDTLWQDSVDFAKL